MIDSILKHKQLTFIVLMMLYYVVKVDLVKGLFYDIKERFDFKNMGKIIKKTDTSDNVSNDLECNLFSPTASGASNSITTSSGIGGETTSSKKCTNNPFDGDKEDVFCNKKQLYDDEDKKRYMCSKNTRLSNDVLKPSHAVPYNFSNSNNNNILYTINPMYTNSKLKYETKIAGDVIASNTKVLHTNFDKNIESYKIGNKISTILNNKDASYNGKFKNICFVKEPLTFQRTLKLFSRLKNNEIVMNWNIPLLPTGFFPKSLIFMFNKNKKTLTIDNSEIHKLEISKKSCSFKDTNELFKIDSILFDNRISYFLTIDIESLFPNDRKGKPQPILFNAQVLFLFDYYNNKQQLEECYMESNISNIDTNKIYKKLIKKFV